MQHGYCQAARACVQGSAACVLLQVPGGRGFRQSEAFGDAQDRIRALQAAMPSVRYAEAPRDFSRQWRQLPSGSAPRTLLVRPGGQARLLPGLWLDDPKPIEHWLRGDESATDTLGGAALVLRRPQRCG